MFACHACGAELELGLNSVIGRRDDCPKCRAPLHACRNCAAYDDSRQNGCIEPNAEPPRDKTVANFCDFFGLRKGAMAARQEDQSARARSALDALFAGKRAQGESAAPADPKERARKALEDLFKK